MKACYRLPYSDVYTEVCHDGAPLLLDAYELLEGKAGFVIAPFRITADTPLVLIPEEGARVRTLPVGEGEDAEVTVSEGDDVSACVDDCYARDFRTFHDAVAEGRFAKLVLSRSCVKTLAAEPDVEELFVMLCRKYPRAMVMMFHTPQTGTWLMATPEILIDRQHAYVCTMALAGTMPYDDGLPRWSEKNKHEQHVVEQYIADAISPLCNHIIKDGPRTVRAGALMHLRTDFRFRMNEGVSEAQLLARLHPTPAVCGLPKHESYDFILQNESTSRRYYSGFAGPWNLHAQTHLYVSLRSMTVSGNCVTAYAGGGIMAESVVDDEWNETELKLISRVLQ